MRAFVTHLSNMMSIIAGVVVLAMTAITFADIVMRLFSRPVPGTYEVVAFLGVAVTGFALPRASLKKAHVYVDLVIDKVSAVPRRVMRITTRVLVAIMFLITAWYFIKMGQSFIATRSVTMTLRLPFYPVVFGMAVSCVVQSLVSICEILEEKGGSNNE